MALLLALATLAGLLATAPLLGDPAVAGWWAMLHWLALATTLPLLLGTWPRGASAHGEAVAILLLAAVARLAFLPLPASDDVHRYLWEGRVLDAGLSPYRYAPTAPELVHLRSPQPTIHQGINHPDLPAIYPPLSLQFFRYLQRGSYSLNAVKWCMAGADLVAVGLLLALLAQRRLAPRLALLYALNPLVLHAFAGGGHLDALLVAAFLGALWAHGRGWWALGFALLGVAVQVKYPVLLALPLLCNRRNTYALWGFVATGVLPFLWFAADGGAVFHSLHVMGATMAFNGPVHTLIQGVIGDLPWSNRICGMLLLAWLTIGLWRFHPGWSRPGQAADATQRGALLLLGGFLILSPTVHFWYLSWILPLAILLCRPSWLVGSAMACLSLQAVILQATTGEWRMSWWAIALQWIPCLLLAAVEFRRDWYRAASMHATPHTLEPGSISGDNPMPNNTLGHDLQATVGASREARRAESVSVIIPVKNEAKRLPACLAAIQRDPAVGEVLVVDAASTDATECLADTYGARYILHARPLEAGGGRGGQICAGLSAARGTVVAIVHADTTPCPDMFSDILSALAANPAAIGGAAGSHFGPIAGRVLLVEWANDLRAAFAGISFGDQIQFFRREVAVAKSLFPDQPLMEDVELSMRMLNQGETLFLWSANAVSPRRWTSGAARRTWVVLSLVGGYLWRRCFGTPDTVAMYRRYYPQPNSMLQQIYPSGKPPTGGRESATDAPCEGALDSTSQGQSGL